MNQKVFKTLEYYNTEKFPDDNGLCESTVYIKRPKNPNVIKTMDIWFNIIN